MRGGTRVVRSVQVIALSSQPAWYAFFTHRLPEKAAARRSTAGLLICVPSTQPMSNGMPGLRSLVQLAVEPEEKRLMDSLPCAACPPPMHSRLAYLTGARYRGGGDGATKARQIWVAYGGFIEFVEIRLAGRSLH